jgi:DNA-binding transcriptional ArsR family regulator
MALLPAHSPLDGGRGVAYRSTMKLNERSTALDLAMMALAHPTRRAILERVMKQESRVTELAEPFAISLNAVSKHIRILERAGLVRRRRAWREHLVSFRAEPLKGVSAWIDRTRAFWTARLDALEELLKAEDAAVQPAEKGGKPK